MKRLIAQAIISAAIVGIGTALLRADTTQITAGLNAPQIGATGGSSVYWGPVVAQTSLAFSGNTNTNYPQKYAGTTISGSGGAAGSRQYCANPGDPTSGPGTIVPPSSTPVYEWYCDVSPVPPAPQADFEYYKYLAQLEGNACAGRPCYQSSDTSFSGTYDPVCTVNGHPKVWFFEGDVSFSGGTYFCGVLLSRGSIGFTGGGAGDITMVPPATAWQQYQVATPNGSSGFGDTAAQDEYPGDGGLNTVKSYNFQQGGGGFNGSPVSFQGYVYATTGYSAGGQTLVVGAVQFGQGSASTAGGGTIFYVPQIIYTVPPGSQVETPIINPNGGTYTGSVSVSISVATQGASIYYTLDGSVPSASSTLYSGPFNLTSDTVVKAIGVRSGLNDSAVATASFTVMPGPANLAPQVDAGSNQTITLPSTATLSGSASDDGLPNPPASLTYAWNKLSGTGVVSFTNPAALATTASFSQAGTYVLRLSVFDGQLSASDDVTVTVSAVPPPVLSFNPASYSRAENQGFSLITVTRQGSDLSGTSSVHYASSDGSATSGVDYVGVSGQLSFAANETSKSFFVQLIDDRQTEGSETVQLTLSQPTGATLGTASAQLTITDASPAAQPAPNPFISWISPYAVVVNQSGTFDLHVFGLDFDPSAAEVLWNGTTPLTVTARSTDTLVAQVNPAIWNNVAGSYPIVVRNPGNVLSNAVPIEVVPLTYGWPGPFVMQEPAANPNPTYTTTSQLSVLGGTFSPGGEAVLTYQWVAVGLQPGVVSFSANGTHAASHVTATFSAPGIYRVRALITDTVLAHTVETGTLDVTVVRKATHLTLSPKSQTITFDQTLTLTAVVVDQWGQPMTVPLNWASSAGSLAPSQTTAVVSPTGEARNIHITAAMTDNSLTDYADVTVLYGANGVASVQEAKIGPVPYKSTSGLPGVTFGNLNPGTKVRIFTITGQLVRTLNSPAGSDLLFDIKNSDGSRIASGVYIYVIDSMGQTRKGKLVLIL